MTWQLLTRMPDRSIAGPLKTWDLSLSLRWREVGSWSVTIPVGSTPAGWPDVGAGLILVRDGTVIASGNVDNLVEEWSADGKDETGGRGRWTLQGDTDLGRIAYRIIYPVPSKSWASHTGTDPSHYKRGPSPGETLIRTIVNEHAGPSALAARRVSGLNIGTSTGIGTSVRIEDRFSLLLDAIRKVADDAGGLGFDVLDNRAGSYDLVVTDAEDKTSTVRFSAKLGNLRNLYVRRSLATANVALLAAEGAKAQRIMREYTRAGERREIFVEGRGVDEDSANAEDEYSKTATEALDAGAEQYGITATTIDTPTMRWGEHYNLGDRVAVLTPNGTEISDIVRGVDIRISNKGVEEVTSTIGNTDLVRGDPLIPAIRRILKDLDYLKKAK